MKRIICKVFGHQPKHITSTFGRSTYGTAYYDTKSTCARCGRRLTNVYHGLFGWYES